MKILGFMTNPSNCNEDQSGKMLRTLLIFFSAIVLRDVSAGTLNWYWTAVMAGVIISFFCLRLLITPEEKTISQTDNNSLIGKREVG